MIALFTKLLPYIFLLYFLIRSIKEPVFLLGIPFLLFLRYSIFFENVKVFAMPGSIPTDIRLLAWMIIVWIISRTRYLSQVNNQGISSYNKSLLNSMDFTIIGLLVISIIGFITVNIEYYFIDDVLEEFIIMSSLFLGYFLIKDVIRFNKYESIVNFLFSIVLVNSVSSLLYILHQGIHYPIYQGEEYSSELFQGVNITRTFWFMPVLCFFSISFLLVFKKTKPSINYVLLGINILALFISYTRSFVIIVIILFVIYLIFEGYKKKKLSIIIKNLVLTGILGLLFFVAISKLLPTNTDYFLSRFSEIEQNPSDEESNSLIYRFSQTSEIIDYISGDKILIGFGPITETQLPFVENMRIVTFDLVWTGVVFRWGYIGLALFILLYSISLVKAFRLFIQGEGLISQLALLVLLTIISQLIESFVSSTFMADNKIAMGLWYFAVLSGLIEISRNNEMLIKEDLYGE